MKYIGFLLLGAFTANLDGQSSEKDCKSSGGKCILKENCPQYKLIEHIPQTHPDFKELVTKWNSRVCDQAPPKVCCPNSQENLLPKPSECGKKFLDFRRIAGGTDAELGEFPWAALLGYKIDGTNDYDYSCGGTLINSRYILTAAHCNAGSKGISIVVLGEVLLGVDPDCPAYCRQDPKLCKDPAVCQPRRQVIEVDHVKIHEDYAYYLQTGDIYINDIALVRLKKDAILNEAVQPICLPLNEEVTANDIGASDLKKGIIGKDVIVVGWGTNDNGVRHDNLQKVQFPIVSTDDCKSQLSGKIRREATVDLNIGPKDICAGELHKDSCKGDSGGGMFISEPWWAHNLTHIYYITHYQIGITSYGYSRCGTGLPAVYTRVTEFIPWIRRSINDDTINTSKATATTVITTKPITSAGSAICFPGEDLVICGDVTNTMKPEVSNAMKPVTISRSTRPSLVLGRSNLNAWLRRDCFGEDMRTSWFYGECRFRGRCRGGQHSYSQTCGKRLECCSRTSKTSTKPTVLTRNMIPPISNVESLNQPNCGFDFPQNFIAGGIVARDGEFPFMVSFVQIDRDSGPENFCGGVLITFRHVLTEAHCFDRYPLSTWTNFPDIDVRIGIANIRDKELRGAKARIQYIDYHPEFRQRTEDSLNPIHDIAIVTLSRRITNDNVNTVCLPTPSHLPSLRPDEHTNLRAILLGWGSNSASSKDSVDHLQKAYTPIVPKEECQRKYSRWLKGKYHVDIGDSMLCAGDTQVDTCPGDSGAPMLWFVNRTSFTVVGIVSFGPPTCGKGVPSVFTKVEKYLDWIASIIQ